jgi:hypothetical protein
VTRLNDGEGLLTAHCSHDIVASFSQAFRHAPSYKKLVLDHENRFVATFLMAPTRGCTAAFSTQVIFDVLHNYHAGKIYCAETPRAAPAICPVLLEQRPYRRFHTRIGG